MEKETIVTDVKISILNEIIDNYRKEYKNLAILTIILSIILIAVIIISLSIIL